MSQKEIYSLDAPFLVYSLAWSNHQPANRLAIGSFIEDYTNKVMILDQDSNERGGFRTVSTFDHPYPPTKIAFSPAAAKPGILATTGDYLRLWSIDQMSGAVSPFATLNQNKSSEFCAPLTSFDWNETNPSVIGTCSIDTTCTIWDIEKQVPFTQLIAHDKEVFDIAFQGNDRFASVGADGSLRIFDLRALDHSTIIYENNQPLLRLSWNKQDPNYLATICMETAECIVIDIRQPSIPAVVLSGHNASISAVQWAPHSSCHLITAGDDKRALIWDLKPLPKPITAPILSYKAEAEINQLAWSSAAPDWIAIAFRNRVQILRV